MHYIVTFETNQFNLAVEQVNPINPINGISVAEWLLARLPESVNVAGNIEPEDWGWSADAVCQNANYMLGFIALPDEQANEPAEIIIIVDKKHTFTEKLFGKNKMDTKDEVLVTIKNIVAIDFPDTKIEILKQG